MGYILKLGRVRIITSFVYVLAVIGFFVDSTAGSLVTVRVNGAIDVIEAPLGDTFSEGNIFNGVFTYDTTTSDVDETLKTGRYEGAIVSAFFQVMDGLSVIYSSTAAPDLSTSSNVIGVFDEFPVPSEGFEATDQVRVAVGSPDQWPDAPLVEGLALTRVFFALLNDNIAHDAHGSDALAEVIDWNLGDYPDESGFFLVFKDPADIGVTPIFEDVAVFGQINSITVLPVGDLNYDGFVGIDDLNIILSHWNEDAGFGNPQPGDITGDGFVGIDDLNRVLGNWNAGVLPPSLPRVAPEPGAVVSVLGWTALLGRRKK